MIFSELYGTYYRAVAEILKQAVNGTLTEKPMIEIVQRRAFSESVTEICNSLKSGKWQLILPDYTTLLKHEPEDRLTMLEKRWLKTILADKRIRLFGVKIDLPDVQPLFDLADIEYFDKYGDGDDFESIEYIKNFTLILQAIKDKYPLQIDIPDRKGQLMRIRAVPEHLEYSEKDDKFRLYVRGAGVKAVNIGKIISVKRYNGSNLRKSYSERHEECAVLEITDERNSLERCLFHFAHFKKEVEQIADNRYRAKIFYDAGDESEMVIRILSFGPMVKAVGSERLVNLIKERLKRQKKLWTE
ncbi:MAG: WYL domain-containing protein [Clostridia bacterium]|nr:WYL domain-containing protein [Clostridia bacterium]